ncbi:FecR domain-containing protein [Steroidobacter sp.]|uniref:FecR domain-containing protein n=1 Tax=Steroidobacter sp. TaxID=1978227 RepID=UPI001A37AD8D|nr:FecR family protein [Steroidobacter sp.]MBL8267880.1 FecR family protein [Steroidobacter sp.]
MNDSPPGAIDPVALDEAAAWVVQLSAGGPLEAEREALAKWRAARPDNELAWRRAEALTRTFDSVSPTAAMAALSPSDRVRRHRATKALAIVAVVALGLAANSRWPSFYEFPDYRTAVGESLTVMLDDGTRVTLNTDSVVDVDFDSKVRRIRLLRGEALIESGHGSVAAGRPLVLENRDGRVVALGTVFGVRKERDISRVAVLEGAVRVEPASNPAAGDIVAAGDAARFDTRQFADEAGTAQRLTSWRDGMLLADEMPLGRLLDEINRYRPGLLQYDSAVAKLPISGAFSLVDTDRALASVAQALPVEVTFHSRSWVRVTLR